MENACRRKKNINRICIKGVWVEGEENIRDDIVNTDLFSNLEEWRAGVEGLNFLQLDALDVKD